VRSRDEVGRLSEAFNAMSGRLAEAHALRRQMTADVAHDLRTPLAILTGYLEALRDGVLAPSPERFATMHDEAVHLGRLVEDLHTLALADAGEIRLRREPVAVAPLLARTMAAFAPEAMARGVTLTSDAPAGLPPLMADPDRLAQVLGNLMRNALRHTPAGGRVTLVARPHPDGLAVIVADTGEGIPPDVLPRVFERTVRADAARGDGGSGLGLAIVRSLVEAHGGTASVASPPGDGTTVTLLLPAAPVDIRTVATPP
jgi:signal transduction histidine kinase